MNASSLRENVFLMENGLQPIATLRLHRVSLLFALSALGPLAVWLFLLGASPFAGEHALREVPHRIAAFFSMRETRWIAMLVTGQLIAFLLLGAAHVRPRGPQTARGPWLDAAGVAATLCSFVVCWPAAISAGVATYLAAAALYGSRLSPRLAQRLRMLRIAAATLVVVFCCGMALYTTAKLYKMCAIRGWVPGAMQRQHVITGKRILEGQNGPVYWIAWEGAAATRPSNQRMNVERDEWLAIAIGDPVTTTYYGSDPTPYKPDGIYASNDNFVFDLVLLAAEILTGLALARYAVRQCARRKQVRNVLEQ